MKTPNYITPSGLKKLQEELHELLHGERPQLVKTISWAAANGDRSENADYIYGKRRLREIDKRIHFLTTRLDNVEVVDPKKISGDRVSFGATVTIEDEEGHPSTYQIVGVDEFEVHLGKISWQSPLAQALMKKSVGDAVIVKRPKGPVEITIVKIEFK
jgi:transcription elongation factor GreB